MKSLLNEEKQNGKRQNVKRRLRMYWVAALFCGSILVTCLVIFALRQNMNLFFTPSQILQGEAPKIARIRIGGMVQKGSLKRDNDLGVQFVVTDFNESITVHYQGILPDLFREGQGVVALGRIQDNRHFIADEVLAKHDENYMPPEVANALGKNLEKNNP